MKCAMLQVLRQAECVGDFFCPVLVTCMGRILLMLKEAEQREKSANM